MASPVQSKQSIDGQLVPAGEIPSPARTSSTTAYCLGRWGNLFDYNTQASMDPQPRIARESVAARTGPCRP